MQAREVQWHGTLEESFALVNATAHNCDCRFGRRGERLVTCSTHQMVIGASPRAQRELDGLLAFRHMRERLLREEGLLVT